MTPLSSCTYPCASGLLVCLILALISAPGAGAAVLSFELQLKDDVRHAEVEPIDDGGTLRVPLGSLARQFGGGYRTIRGRIQVDFVGTTAWIGVNSTEVSASLGHFSLKFPILRKGDENFMALADVGPFFRRAFRLNVRLAGPPGPEMVPEAQPPGPRIQMQELGEPGLASPDLSRESLFRPNDRRRAELIIIDPGHGGTDIGIEGRAGMREKDLTLAVAHKVARLVETSQSLTVLLTRQEDREIAVLERAAFANRNQADLFISIHAGASFAAGAHGFEIFFTDNGHAAEPAAMRTPPIFGDPTYRARFASPSREAAACIAEAIMHETGAALRGIHEAPLRLLKGVRMPGLLIELGCLTNAAEEALLESETRQDQFAKAIASGIKAYVTGAEPSGAVP